MLADEDEVSFNEPDRAVSSCARLWTGRAAATGSGSSSVRIEASGIRRMLAMATGKRGSGGFGTPIGI
jgi:hypothetical protein